MDGDWVSVMRTEYPGVVVVCGAMESHEVESVDGEYHEERLEMSRKVDALWYMDSPVD